MPSEMLNEEQARARLMRRSDMVACKLAFKPVILEAGV